MHVDSKQWNEHGVELSSFTDVHIIGLDLSLTATGWAVRRGHNHFDHGVFPATKLRGVRRLAYLQQQLQKLDPTGNAVVMVEDYAMGAKGKTFHIGEWGGLAKWTIYRWQDSVCLLAQPQNLKQFITGKGNAPKPVVKAEVSKRLGYEVTDDNEADAVGLAMMAYHWYRKLPGAAHEADAMKKVNPCFPIPFEPSPLQVRRRKSVT